MSVYNLKDIIRINQEIGEKGELRSDSSLKFSLSIIKQKKSWLYELSYLVKSLLLDHPFIDGNKKTSYLLCTLYFEDNKKDFHKQSLVESIYTVTKKNITDINKISRLLLKCLIKKD